MENQQQQSQSASDQQILAVHRIYMKGSSFEAAPMTISMMQKTQQPTVDMQIQVNFYPREEDKDLYEAVLTLHLTAKIDGNLIWRLQQQQAGLYTVRGFDEEQVKQILNGHCMNQLYPYASANICAMVTQAGFPPTYLNPVNFDMLYREQQKQAVDQSAGKPHEVVH